MGIKKKAIVRGLLVVSVISFSACNKAENRKKNHTNNTHLEYHQLSSVIQNHKSKDSIYVKPVIYKKMAKVAHLDPDEKKEKFIHVLLPAVLTIQNKLKQKLSRVIQIENKLIRKEHVSAEDHLYLSGLMQEYQARDILDLKKRLKPHMTSLVIAQAAAESGWGTSQLCTRANNLFGMTSVLSPNSKGSYTCKMGNKTVVMRRYPSLLKSIEHYFFVIAIAKSYENFREKRWQGCHLEKLIAELTSYSEQKSYYGNFLRGIINQNELRRYDIYQIDKAVLKQIQKPVKPVNFLGNVIFRPPVFSAFITK